jgi:TPR repeat protein
MNEDPEKTRLAARASYEVGKLAECCQLWLPLAEAGDPEAQSFVGALMIHSLHRYESYETLNSGDGTPIGEPIRAEDREQGIRYLEAASAAGVGEASFNLASTIVVGHDGGTWDERQQRAVDLYALAYAQGFTAFSSLMCDMGDGSPYMNALEANGIRTTPPPSQSTNTTFSTGKEE